MRFPAHTSVATTGVRSSALPARKMGDIGRQVSWLAAQTPLLPSQCFHVETPVAHVEQACRLQLREQPQIGLEIEPHCVPFSPTSFLD